MVLFESLESVKLIRPHKSLGYNSEIPKMSQQIVVVYKTLKSDMQNDL